MPLRQPGMFVIGSRSSMRNLEGLEWWQASGTPGAVAVYQGKGADSYAASKSNLVSPGTHDLQDGQLGGESIGWNATDGWTLGNLISNLLCGTLAISETYSFVVRYVRTGGTGSTLFGSFAGYPNASMGLRIDNSNQLEALNCGSTSDLGTIATSGVLGMAGHQAYYNGSAIGSLVGSAWSTTTGPMAIGYVSGWDWTLEGSVQAVAIYNRTLSASEMAAVMSAILGV